MSFWTMPLPGLMRTKAGGLDVEDVFKTTLYTGNGSTQTINNGIDLAGKGGLVWIKGRNVSGTIHALYDTARGAGKFLQTQTTAAEATNLSGHDLTGFIGTGFTLGAAQNTGVNSSGDNSASWTFRQAPKFFDIVTYTGNGASGRQIAHGLGVTPGFITTKSLSTTGDWNSYHRSATGDLVLNSTAAQAGSRSIITAADATTFTVSGAANTNGVTYVADLFAHDPSPKGIIQCGSYTGNGSSSGPTINLGWQPQYILIKNATATGDWQILDTTRGMSSGNDQILLANTNGAETSVNLVAPNSSGFQIVSTASNVNSNSATYIYMAIRAEGV